MTTELNTVSGASVQPSQTHGQGLFATRDWSAGEILTVLDGQVVPHGDDLEFLKSHEWNAINADEILLRPVWTSYRFINHGRPGNLTFSIIHQTLATKTPVTKGLEFLLDYTEHGIPEVYLNSEHGRFLA